MSGFGHYSCSDDGSVRSLLSLQLLQCLAKLIRARSDFVTAAYSFEFVYYVVDFLTCHEAADALEVSVAAAEEGHVLYDVVVVGGDVDKY